MAEETKNLWWGYRHILGSYQVKHYNEPRDIQEALDSEFCEHVVGPFPAYDREYAMHMCKRLVNSLNTDPPSEVEENLYYCMHGAGGSFSSKLFETIMHADIHNQHKLSLGFPEEVKVAQKYKNEPGYWEQLKVRIKNSNKNDSIQE